MTLFEQEKLEEKQLDSEEVYHGRLLHIYKDHVLLPSGKTSVREYNVHNGAVAVVALTADHKIAMERQFRYPFHAVLQEIPAGKIDGSEDTLKAAQRELLEETGIQADEWTYLSPFYPSCAYTTEVIHLYMASGLHYGDRKLDEGEFLNVEMLDIQKVVDDIMAGKIPDGKTIAAVLQVYTRIQNK